MTVRAKYLGGKSLAAIVASTAFLTVMSGSAAFAQNCTGVTSGPFANQLGGAAAAGGSASGSFAGALGNLATAFTTQQGSAFVSAPGDPKPNQEGGGVWTRAVGGEVTNTFSSNATGSVIGPPLPDSNAAVTCAGSVHQTFAGLQVGTDISRLNVNGWNIHLGTMAGYLNAHATDNVGGTSDFDVPFFGTYLVATYGRFFADIGIREEYYSASLNNPTVGLFGQRVGANGTSISTSAGYNFALANNWFIEPSAGFIWSRTKVDPFFISGGVGGAGIVSSFQTNPIESEIGRLTVRVGTTVNAGAIIWQPFATASVFHEFAGNVTSTANSLPGGAFGTVCPIPGLCTTIPVTLNGTNSTTRVGTYGQYSLGLAAQVANTGWLGFVRVDYRNGSTIEGWTGNAGLRYQFTPETLMAAVMPRKAPMKAVPYIGATNWGGFYAGGFLGMDYGNTRINMAGDPGPGSNPKVAGALGGFELGYNWHLPNQFVLGVEGDIGSTNMHGGQSCGQDAGRDASGVTVRFPSAYLNCQNSSNWMATLAARLGYASGRTLYYVKAGGAYADDHVSTKCIFGPLNGGTDGSNVFGPCLNPAAAFTNGFSTNGYRSGWLLGFGTEFDLGHNWSAKGEYNYIDFGSRTALASDGTTVVRDSGVINQVKIGVNYRFAAQPIVARY